jgi:hypothetical protein
LLKQGSVLYLWKKKSYLCFDFFKQIDFMNDMVC